MNPVRLSATPGGRACAGSETYSSGMDMPETTIAFRLLCDNYVITTSTTTTATTYYW
jgi:hypothetical protein